MHKFVKFNIKKISLFFLSFLILISSYLTILAPTAHAQTWYNQNPFEWYVKVYDTNVSPPNEIFGERYTAAQVQWVVWSLLFMPVRLVETIVGENTISCFIKGAVGIVDIKDCGGAIISFVDKIIDIVPTITLNTGPNDNNKSIATLVFNNNRDLSGIGYTKNLLKKFTFVSEVKAQGYGYTGLSWIQKYWAGFRDISYVLLVLVVIIFAFMIMFRVKLNPQTVISVQSALPKIVIALILITFSYAIAGFAIDLMYVISGLFALLLNLAKFSSSLTGAYGTIAGTGAGYSTSLGGFWVFFMMLAYAIVFFVSAFISLITTFLAGFSIFGMVLAIIFMIIAVACLLIMLWYTIKIPYVLLKTLVSVYISIITAPIQIMAGAIIPSMGFGAWFKKLMADILVFPITGLLIWFAWATLWSSFGLAIGDVGRYWSISMADDSWIPGIIGAGTLAGTTTGLSGIIFLAISFSIILLIPKVPDIIKSFMMGEKFAGTGIGEALGPIRQYGPGFGMYGLRELSQGRYPITGKELPSKTEGRVSKAAGWLWGKASGVQQAVRGQ